MSRSLNQQLVDVFLQHLESSAVVIELYDTFPNLRGLVDAYNRYAVRNGNIVVIDPDQTTIGNLKHQLVNLPTKYLRTVLFTFSNTDEDAQDLAKAEKKEVFKQRLILFGFLFIVVAVFAVLGITLVHTLRTEGDLETGILSELVGVVVEVFKIITKL